MISDRPYPQQVMRNWIVFCKTKTASTTGLPTKSTRFLTCFHPTCTIIIHMERVFRMSLIILNTQYFHYYIIR